ncbi:hypothetical protein Tco_1548585 [Tanacetum coccineum]
MVPSNSERIKFNTSLANIAWQIWKSRNAYVFSDVRPCLSSTISRLNCISRDFNSVFPSSLPISCPSVDRDESHLSRIVKPAISLASSDVDPPWSLYAIVANIRIWASQLALSFSWVKRECNLASHLSDRAEGIVVPSAGAKPWREKKEWRITPWLVPKPLGC